MEDVQQQLKQALAPLARKDKALADQAWTAFHSSDNETEFLNSLEKLPLSDGWKDALYTLKQPTFRKPSPQIVSPPTGEATMKPAPPQTFGSSLRDYWQRTKEAIGLGPKEDLALKALDKRPTEEAPLIPLSSFAPQNPTTFLSGATLGAAQGLEAVTTPKNATLQLFSRGLKGGGGLAIAKTMQTAFRLGMFDALRQEIPELDEAWKRGDKPEAGRLFGKAVMDLIFMTEGVSAKGNGLQDNINTLKKQINVDYPKIAESTLSAVSSPPKSKVEPPRPSNAIEYAEKRRDAMYRANTANGVARDTALREVAALDAAEKARNEAAGSIFLDDKTKAETLGAIKEAYKGYPSDIVEQQRREVRDAIVANSDLMKKKGVRLYNDETLALMNWLVEPNGGFDSVVEHNDAAMKSTLSDAYKMQAQRAIDGFRATDEYKKLDEGYKKSFDDFADKLSKQDQFTEDDLSLINGKITNVKQFSEFSKGVTEKIGADKAAQTEADGQLAAGVPTTEQAMAGQAVKVPTRNVSKVTKEKKIKQIKTPGEGFAGPLQAPLAVTATGQPVEPATVEPVAPPAAPAEPISPTVAQISSEAAAAQPALQEHAPTLQAQGADIGDYLARAQQIIAERRSQFSSTDEAVKAFRPSDYGTEPPEVPFLVNYLYNNKGKGKVEGLVRRYGELVKARAEQEAAGIEQPPVDPLGLLQQAAEAGKRPMKDKAVPVAPPVLTNRQIINRIKTSDQALYAAAMSATEGGDSFGTWEQKQKAYRRTLVKALDPKRLTASDRDSLMDIAGLPEGTMTVFTDKGKFDKFDTPAPPPVEVAPADEATRWAEQQGTKFTGPPYPHHSNYEVTMVVDAIQHGESVPQPLLDKYKGNSAVDSALAEGAVFGSRQAATPPTAPLVEQPSGSMDVADRQPWEMTRGELVNYKDTIPRPKYTPKTSGGYSEAELHERTLSNRAAETEPPDVTHHPVGSWATDSDGELMQLREYRLDDPKLIFPEELPRSSNRTVEKYAEWVNKGSEPPPLKALETDKGNIKISEGHHRAAALLASGRKTAKVWVAVTHNRPLPNGAVMPEGVTHEKAVRQALSEGKPVPAAVLAEYPDLQAKAPAKAPPASPIIGPTPAPPATHVKSTKAKAPTAPPTAIHPDVAYLMKKHAGLGIPREAWEAALKVEDAQDSPRNQGYQASWEDAMVKTARKKASEMVSKSPPQS